MLEVSVVIAVYRDVFNLKDTVESVLRQCTNFDFNIVLVSDGNSKSDFEEIQKFRCDKLEILENIENLGLTVSLIKGIQSTTARYIARIDVGDIMLTTNRLQRQYDCLKSHSGCVITGHRYFLYTDSLKSLYVSRKLPKVIEEVAFHKTLFGHVTVMFDKVAYEACGGYNSQLRTGQDSDLWPRLLRHGHAIFDPRIMTLVTMNEQSISVSQNNQQYISKIKRLWDNNDYINAVLSVLKLCIPRDFRLRLMYKKSYTLLSRNISQESVIEKLQ
jgi:glycosyltransferase involved in cell wall biosynthesis